MKSLKTLSLLLIFFCSCSQKETSRFIEIQSPASGNSSLPRLNTDDSNTTIMSWVEETEDLAQLKYAKFDGSNWSDSKAIAEDSTWFLNWADFPSVISYKGAPLAAHWLNKKPGGTYAYDVNISTFSNESWSSSFVPHQDNTPTEHGFVSMAPMSDSTFLAVWLDGRETAGRSHDEYLDIDKAMTLRAAVIHKNGKVLERYLIDDSVCDCCNTSLTKTDDGGYILAYRNRTSKEIRDIYFTKFRNGEWSQPKPVSQDNWEIAACPVNGPAIASEENIVAVSWFTGANDQEKVKLGISNNFGENIQNILLIDDKNPAGRVDLMIKKGKIWLSWLSEVDEAGQLNIAAYTFKGELINQYFIPNVSAKRSSGFPQITKADKGILIAYTEVFEEGKRIRTFELN